MIHINRFIILIPGVQCVYMYSIYHICMEPYFGGCCDYFQRLNCETGISDDGGFHGGVRNIFPRCILSEHAVELQASSLDDNTSFPIPGKSNIHSRSWVLKQGFHVTIQGEDCLRDGTVGASYLNYVLLYLLLKTSISWKSTEAPSMNNATHGTGDTNHPGPFFPFHRDETYPRTLCVNFKRLEVSTLRTNMTNKSSVATSLFVCTDASEAQQYSTRRCISLLC